MRKFFSYGPVNPKLHYYAPREGLINRVYNQLVGDDQSQGGHYMTVWAPRQTGKTWVMQEVLHRLKGEAQFHVAKLNLQDLESQETTRILQSIAQRLSSDISVELPSPKSSEEFAQIFTQKYLDKPLILFLDEFDTLPEEGIRTVVSVFRNLYIERGEETDKESHEKDNLLHGLALIGVRNVLGIDSRSGSPFNVQRSVHIPDLTHAEVEGMYRDYERESGQAIDQAVIDRIFYEMQGQPGLTCWLGELLTETYNEPSAPITMDVFEPVYGGALNVPNNNILNVLSKAQLPEYRSLVLGMFEANAKLQFRFDDPQTNFLYLNGVVDREVASPDRQYLKFPSPYVQKRLFNYFAHELYPNLGRLHDPFEKLDDTVTETALYIKQLIRRYESYLQKNGQWLFQGAPRRLGDERIYEAVYHFNLYMYLSQFLQSYDSKVYPEFPTGNGQIDLFIRHADRTYGIEVKSFANRREYGKALIQTATYGHQLGLTEMWLVFFVEVVDDDIRREFEATYIDPETDVTVHPLLVAVG